MKPCCRIGEGRLRCTSLKSGVFLFRGDNLASTRGAGATNRCLGESCATTQSDLEGLYDPVHRLDDPLVAARQFKNDSANPAGMNELREDRGEIVSRHFVIGNR